MQCRFGLSGKRALTTNFDLGTSQQHTDLRIDWTAPGRRRGFGIFADKASVKHT